MTMQMKDEFSVFGEQYDVVATTDDFFSPREYGLKKEFMNTACWRGYWCKISIDEEKGMILNDLHINRAGNEDTLLNGKQISSHGVYRDIELCLPFSGKMLFGRKPKYTVGSYMCEAAWGYKELIELNFEDGKVIKTIDYSNLAKRFQRKYRISQRIQKIVEEHEYEDGTDDYNIKLWWLKYTPSLPAYILFAPIDMFRDLLRFISKHLENGFYRCKHHIEKILEKLRRNSDAKHDEAKFIFSKFSLEDEHIRATFELVLKDVKAKRVIVISPDSYISEVFEVNCKSELELIGFEDKNIVFATEKTAKRRMLRKYDYIYFPNGDPFALRSFIYYRLKCFDSIKSAMRRGVTCIAIGESAMACGNCIEVKDSAYSNSCHRIDKSDDTPSGIDLFQGNILLSKSDRNKECDKSVWGMDFCWESREVHLYQSNVCIVDGEKEEYL